MGYHLHSDITRYNVSLYWEWDIMGYNVGMYRDGTSCIGMGHYGICCRPVWDIMYRNGILWVGLYRPVLGMGHYGI